ncbi:MAG: DNA translocase FtsK 4TM domain-containing protein [Candidatus Krumholzibacteria bacterium]
MNRSAKYFFSLSFLALAAFLAVAFATISSRDWPFAEGTSFDQVSNLSGPLGSGLAYASVGLLGRLFAWVIPLSLVMLSMGLLVDKARSAAKLAAKSLVIVLLLGTFFSLVPFTRESMRVTGSIGSTVGGVIESFVGEIGGSILIITLLMLVLLTEVRYLAGAALGALRITPGRSIVALAGWRAAFHNTAEWVRTRARSRHEASLDPTARSRRGTDTRDERAATVSDDFNTPWLAPTYEPPLRTVSATRVAGPSRAVRPARVVKTPGSGTLLDKAELPPISILASGGVLGAAFSSDHLKSWTEVLVDKLANYGIHGHVTAVSQGPMVTTFEFEPAPGVKIKDIVSRSDDLALAMRARSLRLIAPIPGRAVVGIEIPNPEQAMVYLRDCLEEVPERLRYSGIMIAVGVDAMGKPFHMNLCSAPHLLMAGTTGSGKSVSLNGFLASILFQYRPSDVRLILIDPKMVEMSIFNGIPHLLHPVVTDTREAVRIFHYLIREMERRNRLLHENGVKNIESFNTKIAMEKVKPSAGTVAKLPYIVLVVDELADLVLTKGADFETLFSRLSNMARAVGIHMIVATQRPSVDIIDGKTKANFPTRIAFRVASRVDSRTILDCGGADKLLGMGDMLYVDAKHPEALRLHGAWMSEEELQVLVAHWKQYEYDESHLDLFEERAGTVSAEERDAYFEDARGIVLRHRQGSTSLLQRKLHVGYARAARLLDQLEESGIVGPPDGSKPREVLVREEHSPHIDGGMGYDGS